jgi:GNAT superfamily N-acetyltransferase
MNILDLLMGERRKVRAEVEMDEFVERACEALDYTFKGYTEFELWDKPDIPEDFTVGMIVGDSGTGKSLLLKDFGEEENFTWERHKAIVSHFQTPDDAIERLMSVGLNTIPSWLKPHHVLSFGEQYRAKIARGLKDGAVFDEFTSVVDRDTAKSLSVSVRRYIDKENLKGVVVATCHEDILEWLCPDWVFNTNTGVLSVGRSLRTPLQLQIFRTSTDYWGMFAKYHYLTGQINKASTCYLALIDEKPVGFLAILPFPSGTIKNAVRGHRLVVLPKYQGFGIGVRLIEAVAQTYIDQDKRFFGKTAHPRLGEQRERSPKWKPTSKNRVYRTDRYTTMVESFQKNKDHSNREKIRVCYSHEYIGIP